MGVFFGCGGVLFHLIASYWNEVNTDCCVRSLSVLRLDRTANTAKEAWGESPKRNCGGYESGGESESDFRAAK